MINFTPDFIINAVTLAIVWVAVLYLITLPALSRFIDKREKRSKDAYNAIIDDKIMLFKADMNENFKHLTSPEGSKAVWAAFFTEETAAKIGTDIMIPEINEQGIVTGQKKAGVYTASYLLVESVVNTVFQYGPDIILACADDPRVKTLFHTYTQQAYSKFGAGIKKFNQAEEIASEVLAEEYQLDDGEVSALLEKNPALNNLMGKFVEKMMVKMGMSEDEATATAYSYVKRKGLDGILADAEAISEKLNKFGSGNGGRRALPAARTQSAGMLF